MSGVRHPDPRHEFGDAVRGVSRGNLGQKITEPGFRIDAVELGGLDQRIDGGGALTALVRACKGPVAAAQRNAAQAVLGAVVVRLEAAVVAEAGQGVRQNYMIFSLSFMVLAFWIKNTPTLFTTVWWRCPRRTGRPVRCVAEPSKPTPDHK